MKSAMIVFGLLLASTTLFAQTSPEAVKVYEQVEQMPRFKADCPDLEDQKRCSDRKMLEYVYENVAYPKEASKKEAEGMVVVSFVVEKDGTVSKPEIYRDQVGFGAGEEVIRIVKSMNDGGPAWSPGLLDGKPVRVEFKLPVKFVLGK